MSAPLAAPLVALFGLVRPKLFSAILALGLLSVTYAKATGQVSVTPDGGSAAAPAQGAGDVTFSVHNPDPVTQTYDFSCSFSGALTSCGVFPSSATVPSNESTTVSVSFSTGAAGSGTLTLSAVPRPDCTDACFPASEDTGWYDVTVTAATPSVAVLPDGDTLRLEAGTSVRSTFFTVQNGDAAQTYSFSCSALAPVTCVGVTPSSASLAATQQTTVRADYTATSVGTGRVTLTAVSGETSDDGHYVVVAAERMAPLVDAAGANPGTTFARGLCLTVAAGPAAVSECGDLRVAHALATTRSLNKARTPVLLYNSQHAHPYVLVAAWVTLPTDAAVPDTVLVTLRVAGVQRASGVWPGASWTPGRTYRIVLPYDALDDATGFYEYELEVTHCYAGNCTYETVAGGELAVVNRKDSPFGGGWWLAGLEQIQVLSGYIRWTGGDGSARRHVQAGTDVWVAPSLDRPDTIRFDGTHYRRLLPHGVVVKFNSAGQHVATLNRLGHETSFSYDPASGRLASIALPPASASLSYQFAYGVDGRLQSVTAPPANAQARVTRVHVSAGRVDSIADPDGRVVRFAHDPGVANRIIARTNRRGRTTTYAFDAAHRLAESRLDMDAGQTAIVSLIRAQESLGLPGVVVDSADAYTRLDGPRTDVGDTTSFWLNGFGAPHKIRDALGNETTLARGDNRFPALVTRIRHPNGRIVAAAYDPRGNILTQTDSSTFQNGRYATTRYEWEPTWDFVTQIVPPEGDSTIIAYDATNGNRLWQQDARGATSRVTFSYYASGTAAGLLASVKPPITPATTIGYDATGNIRAVTSPLGFVTSYHKDNVGRDTLVTTPIDSAQTRFQRHRSRYDLMDRVLTAVSAATDSAIVTHTYDEEGNPTTLSRRSDPDTAGIGTITTRWRYDPANRAVAEVAPDGAVDSTVYDPAGNVTERVSRRGHSILMKYDQLNRLAEQVTPVVIYRDTMWGSERFPRYPNCQTTYLCFPGDTATFTYDAVGNVLTASNREARIKRTYNVNGTLRSDTLRIRTWAELASGGNFTSHVYGLRYGYDLNARRLWLIYPRQLGARFAANPSIVYDSLAYDYNSFGALGSIRDPIGNVYGFAYDLDSRLDKVLLPSGHIKQYTYNDEGWPAVIRQDRTATNGGAKEHTFLYDARGKIVAIPQPSTSGLVDRDFSYTALGLLRSANTHTWYEGERSQSELRAADAIGNVAWSHDTYGGYYWSEVDGGIVHFDGGALNRNQYAPSVGRVETSTEVRSHNEYPSGGSLSCGFGQSGRAVRTWLYDRAGNQYWVAANAYDTLMGDGVHCPHGEKLSAKRAASYYDAMSRLRVFDRRGVGTELPGEPPAYEEHRYDALGRRVVRRARIAIQTQPIQRYIWDGDQLIAEIQYPGGDGETATSLERDTTTLAGESRYWGRVLYVPGDAIDQPLAVVRIGYSKSVDGTLINWDPLALAPDWDWRGNGYGHAFYGPTAECQTVSGAQHCVELKWPVNYADRNRARGTITPTNPEYTYGGWFGSLLHDQRDASGQLYRRNRYYDPATGRFTQEDPIGLAGGLNLYGFADADPVNVTDPFGLCPKRLRDGAICIDFFIMAASDFGYKGDNRHFDPDAPFDASRAQFIILPGDLSHSYMKVSKSCTTSGECYPPLESNSFSVTGAEDGSFTLRFDLKDSAAPLGLAPDLKGRITFRPDGQGGYTTSGRVDSYPSHAIYLRGGGAWKEIRRHTETTPWAMLDQWPKLRW